MLTSLLIFNFLDYCTSLSDVVSPIVRLTEIRLLVQKGYNNSECCSEVLEGYFVDWRWLFLDMIFCGISSFF